MTVGGIASEIRINHVHNQLDHLGELKMDGRPCPPDPLQCKRDHFRKEGDRIGDVGTELSPALLIGKFIFRQRGHSDQRIDIETRQLYLHSVHCEKRHPISARLECRHYSLQVRKPLSEFIFRGARHDHLQPDYKRRVVDQLASLLNSE